ncbi:hypothetical protein GYMLUDRAFT_176784, partial [Collybiopsis luxurians FD-317 M1]
WNKEHPYVERHRTANRKRLDEVIPDIIEWLRNPQSMMLEGKLKSEVAHFKRQVLKFYLNNEGKLY